MQKLIDIMLKNPLKGTVIIFQERQNKDVNFELTTVQFLLQNL